MKKKEYEVEIINGECNEEEKMEIMQGICDILTESERSKSYE